MKVPRGWRLIGFTRCGSPVLTPTTKKGQARHFVERTIAYIDRGTVRVRTEETWFNDAGLRAHEEEHLKQERWLGMDVFEKVYSWCHDVVGYKNNPFEIAALRAEKRRTR